ncbi:MAG: hypothetical protein JO141_11170, partial [Bradyrhizobium sp.]|nr:hypothetical protein [Bradyrhizobium sp.]
AGDVHVAHVIRLEIALDPGPEGADEAALRGLGIMMSGRNQNRPRRFGFFCATVSLHPASAVAIRASDTPAKSLENAALPC